MGHRTGSGEGGRIQTERATTKPLPLHRMGATDTGNINAQASRRRRRETESGTESEAKKV